MKLKKDTSQRLIITYNDAPIVQIGNTVNLSGALVISDGSEFKPSIVFQSNRNAGIYFNSNVIQFTTPIKSPEIFSEAITFGSSKLIQTNNSFSLSNKDNIILDVKDDKLYIPDVYTDAINNFIYLTHDAAHVDGSLSSKVLTFDEHPDHFINYNNGICFSAKNNTATLDEDNFKTPNIVSDIITTTSLNVENINSDVFVKSCTSNKITSSIIKVDDLEVQQISPFRTTDIVLNNIEFKGSFCTFKSSVNTLDGKILVLNSSSKEIRLNDTIISKAGIQSSSTESKAECGTFRYNPDIDNIEYKSKDSWKQLNQEKTILDLKEEIRILRAQLNELKEMVAMHINTHNA